MTFGTGAAQGEDWPALLSGMTGWQVVNAGIPGDTAQAARAKIQDVLSNHQPTLVIIEICGENFLRRRVSEHAKEERILFIPEVFSKVLAQAELGADRIHPNAQGYRACLLAFGKSVSRIRPMTGRAIE